LNDIKWWFFYRKVVNIQEKRMKCKVNNFPLLLKGGKVKKTHRVILSSRKPIKKARLSTGYLFCLSPTPPPGGRG